MKRIEIKTVDGSKIVRDIENDKANQIEVAYKYHADSHNGIAWIILYGKYINLNNVITYEISEVSDDD